MNLKHTGKKLIVPALTALALCLESPRALAQISFVQTNLVSDIPGLAAFTDPRLVNPWGISYSATGPFWISDESTGLSTVYNTAGTPFATPFATLPNPSGGLLSPTGQVFNGGAAFNADRFIFATEQGMIAGWRGGLGTTAEILFNNSNAGANYKGLAIGTVGSGTYLYAADFRNNRIDVFGSTGAPALPGTFLAPPVPAGYAPFNIQNLNGKLYVTYAVRDATGTDDVAGAGNGLVDVFDLNGNFQQRLISNGNLNSPWGLAIAPGSFGELAGSLLVGNSGDGTINAFDPLTGLFWDTLSDINGDPLVIEGLWGLIVGNGGTGGDLGALYFTAGISGGGDAESHGLFGRINAIPEPGTVAAGFVLSVSCVVVWLRRRRTP